MIELKEQNRNKYNNLKKLLSIKNDRVTIIYPKSNNVV